jgi:nucleoside-diphosphate-sugar epimerase
MSNKRTFIIGLESFTGRYLKAELVAAGYEVFGTVRTQGYQLGANQLACDLLDKKKLAYYIKDIRPDFIINLASISFVKHDLASDLYQINQLGVLSLLEAIAQSGHLPSKLLLVSSAHVYGNQGIPLISEHCLPRPNSDYAVSKLAMEQLAKLWFDRLPVIITRPFNYTGVGQSSLFLPSKIVSHFKQKAPYVELGNIEIARDWSDVRDVVACYRYLLESDRNSLIVNICSGLSHSLRSILSMLTEISGHELPIKVNLEFVRTNEVKELSGDNRLLFSIIPKIERRPLKETLTWMYQTSLS